ncbi:hypothetical protein [Embleya sp. NPDC020886]|uniref:hypothetical protein n=1 Tax=Embleya sp. NPDC020886 TaxID=3363980 RepID=UPI0037B7B833
MAPEQAPALVVVVDRRIDDVPIRRAMWPAVLLRSPVLERGVEDQPVVAFERLIGLLTLMARHKRVVVLGAQPHTTVVALAVLVAAGGSISRARELYTERGAAELPADGGKFLMEYLLRFEVPYMTIGRETDGWRGGPAGTDRHSRVAEDPSSCCCRRG